MMEPQKKKHQSRILSEAEHRAILKNMLFVSTISADNDEFSEDTKQEILDRYNKYKDEKLRSADGGAYADAWEYILNPLSNDGVSQETISKYAEIMRA